MENASRTNMVQAETNKVLLEENVKMRNQALTEKRIMVFAISVVCNLFLINLTGLLQMENELALLGVRQFLKRVGQLFATHLRSTKSIPAYTIQELSEWYGNETHAGQEAALESLRKAFPSIPKKVMHLLMDPSNTRSVTQLANSYAHIDRPHGAIQWLEEKWGPGLVEGFEAVWKVICKDDE